MCELGQVARFLTTSRNFFHSDPNWSFQNWPLWWRHCRKFDCFEIRASQNLPSNAFVVRSMRCSGPSVISVMRLFVYSYSFFNTAPRFKQNNKAGIFKSLIFDNFGFKNWIKLKNTLKNDWKWISLNVLQVLRVTFWMKLNILLLLDYFITVKWRWLSSLWSRPLSSVSWPD